MVWYSYSSTPSPLARRLAIAVLVAVAAVCLSSSRQHFVAGSRHALGPFSAQGPLVTPHQSTLAHSVADSATQVAQLDQHAAASLDAARANAAAKINNAHLPPMPHPAGLLGRGRRLQESLLDGIQQAVQTGAQWMGNMFGSSGTPAPPAAPSVFLAQPAQASGSDPSATGDPSTGPQPVSQGAVPGSAPAAPAPPPGTVPVDQVGLAAAGPSDGSGGSGDGGIQVVTSNPISLSNPIDLQGGNYNGELNTGLGV